MRHRCRRDRDTHLGERRLLGSLLRAADARAGLAWDIGGDGRRAGSVSGGCVEDDLAERVRAGEFSAPGPKRIDYGVTREQGERFGLPCGGRLELVLEPLHETDEDIKLTWKWQPVAV